MKNGHTLLFSGLLVVGLAVALALLAPWGQDALAQGDTIYVDVDATGANDGSSWTDAFTTLQAGLDAATTTDQIWVATGVYRPTQRSAPGDPRSATFQMANGVALYGGFDPDAGDVAWEDRHWGANPTVLSGDIGIEGDATDNAYHVFYHPDGANLDSTAILDGFTITGGNANGGADPRWHGAGMYNYGSSPTLANCSFSDNTADSDGGGIYNDAGSSPTLTNCTFSSNSAGDDGGGVYNSAGSSPTLTDCTFSDNSAGSVGGFGGGMLNNNSSPLLTGCVFLGNSADSGGGIYNATSSASLTNCVFAGNTANTDGGGMLNDNSSPTLTNCTFFGNSASDGGGIYNFNSSPTLTNGILWGDTPDEMYNADPTTRVSSPVVTYSDIQGGCDTVPGNQCGAGNIAVNPLFVDAPGGDLRLQLTSPAIDAGDNDAPGLAGITTDLGDHPRRVDVPSVTNTGNGDPPIVDMGAYETPPDVIYVDQDATGDTDGSSWDNALTDLEDALSWAVEGVEIWVAEGIYKPAAEHGGAGDRFRSFQMINGVAIYGGFDPGSAILAFEDRDWDAYPTTLSGDIGTEGDTADNAYHVFYHPDGTDLDSTAVLDGFIVTDGNANGDADPHQDGAGMYNHSSSPTLANCTFTDNAAHSAGSGGGMLNNSSSPALTNCTFSGNSAALGGGVYNADSSPTLANCTFWNNSASNDGGAMLNDNSSPTLTNCTFWGNLAGDGGGIYDFFSSPTLTNCILWGNTPDQIYNADPATRASSPVVSYSDIQGGCATVAGNVCGMGNIDADPLFVDPDNGDFHLGALSPCIDTGDNAAPSLPPYDFEGDPRIMDGNHDGTPTVDMGVDEALWYPIYLPIVLSNY